MKKKVKVLKKQREKRREGRSASSRPALEEDKRRGLAKGDFPLSASAQKKGGGKKKRKSVNGRKSEKGTCVFHLQYHTTGEKRLKYWQ